MTNTETELGTGTDEPQTRVSVHTLCGMRSGPTSHANGALSNLDAVINVHLHGPSPLIGYYGKSRKLVRPSGPVQMVYDPAIMEWTAFQQWFCEDEI